MLTPLNETIAAWTSTHAAATADVDDEQDREPEPKHHKEEHHKNGKHHDHEHPTDAPEANDKMCADYARNHHDQMFEAEMAAECARRAKNKKKHPHIETEASADEVAKEAESGYVGRDKRGMNVYANMFLRNDMQ